MPVCVRRAVIDGRHNPYLGDAAAARLLEMGQYARSIEHKDDEAYRASMERAVVRQKFEYPIMARNPAALGAGKQSEGDFLVERIESALAYLDTVGFRRSKHQRIFHKAFLASQYGQLYGNELHQHLVRLLENNGWSELRSEVVAITPRRFGKSKLFHSRPQIPKY